MTKYAALLRGINVGGRIIKMADLKSCLDKAGLKNVKTVLQSGNVIFESDISDTDKLKQQMEQTLTGAFEYPAKVQILPMEKLQKIITANPFADAPADYHQYVIFIENDLETQLVAEAGKQLGEEVQAGQGVVYWKVKKGNTLKSPLGKLLTKSRYKEFNTNRNVNTLKKMLI